MDIKEFLRYLFTKENMKLSFMLILLIIVVVLIILEYKVTH